jgi:hypothetical protein
LVLLNGADFLQSKEKRKSTTYVSVCVFPCFRHTDGWHPEAVSRIVGDAKTYKIDSNGRNVRFRVRVVGKSKQQTGLSDTGVSNKEQFKKVIAAVPRINNKKESQRHATNNKTRIFGPSRDVSSARLE